MLIYLGVETSAIPSHGVLFNMNRCYARVYDARDCKQTHKQQKSKRKKNTHTFLFSRWNRCNWFYSLIIRQWYKLYKKKKQPINQWISSQTNLTNRYKRSVFFGSCVIITLIRSNFEKNSRRNSFPIQMVSFKPIRKDMHSSMFDSRVK